MSSDFKMNNTIITWITLLLIPQLFIGCANEEEVAHPINKPCKVEFQYNVIDPEVSVSRAGVIEGTKLPDGHKVGIYALMTNWTGTAENMQFNDVGWFDYNLLPALDNRPYHVSSSSQTSQNHIMYLTPDSGGEPYFQKDEKAALKIYAYAPYTDQILRNTSNQRQIKIDVKNDVNQMEDYLWATPKFIGQVGESGAIASVQFKHVMSRLKFWVGTNDHKFTESYCPKLTKIVLKTRHHQGGFLNLENGLIEGSKEDTNKEFTYVLPEPFKIIHTKKGEQQYVGAEFMLMPDENAIDEIIMWVENPEKDPGKSIEVQKLIAYKYNPFLKNEQALESGKVHIAVTEYKIRPNIDCSIIGWETVSNSDMDLNDNNLVK